MECCNGENPIPCKQCGRGSLGMHKVLMHAERSTGQEIEIKPLKELERIPLSPDIKLLITKKYQEGTDGQIKRNAPRRGIIYCCIILVCREKGMPFDPDSLRVSLNLLEKHINAAKKFLRSRLGKISTDVTIRDYLNHLFHLYEMKPSCMDEIMGIYDLCRKRSVLFNSSKISTLATGLVYNYLKRVLDEFDEDAFFEKSNVRRHTTTCVDQEIDKYIQIEN